MAVRVGARSAAVRRLDGIRLPWLLVATLLRGAVQPRRPGCTEVMMLWRAARGTVSLRALHSVTGMAYCCMMVPFYAHWRCSALCCADSIPDPSCKHDKTQATAQT